MNSFYGGIFIDRKKLEEEGKGYPIKIEYYKKINEDEIVKKQNPKYGISIVKTEYIPNNTRIERKEIKYLSKKPKRIKNTKSLFYFDSKRF